MASRVGCPCEIAQAPNRESIQVTSFYNLRKECPALRLLIPDKIAYAHYMFTTSKPDLAFHASIPYLAFRRGILPALTAPIHRFAIGDSPGQHSLTNQYRKDLSETWVLEPTEKDRYRLSRKFQSRLAELAFAQFLEAGNWQIRELEAHGAPQR